MKLNTNKINKGILAGLIAAGIFSGAFYAFALPYSPGETTNPTCSPTDTDCTVTPSAVYSYGANNFSGTGNFVTTGTGSFSQLTLTTTALTVGNGGTGLGTIAAGSILGANSANTLTAITSTSGTKYLQNANGTLTWGTITIPAEADTLATVTARGASSSEMIVFSNRLRTPMIETTTSVLSLGIASGYEWVHLTDAGSGKVNMTLGHGQTVGTSGANVFAIQSGTAPSTSPADAVQIYAGDVRGAAGNAGLLIRGENGLVGGIAGSEAFLNKINFSTTDLGQGIMLNSGGGWNPSPPGTAENIYNYLGFGWATASNWGGLWTPAYNNNKLAGSIILTGGVSTGYTTDAGYNKPVRIIGAYASAGGSGASIPGGNILLYAGNHSASGTVEGSVIINNADGTTKMQEWNESKIGFFGATPVVQQSGDIGTALVSLGLMSSANSTDTSTITNRLTLIEQNAAYERWFSGSHAGAGDQTWMQMFIDNMQDNTGMSVSTNAYYDSSAKKWSTVTPGDVNWAPNATFSFVDCNAPQYPASRFNDGSIGAGYLGFAGTPGGQTYGIILIDLGANEVNWKPLSNYTIYRSSNSYPQTPVTWLLQYSDDNSNWTLVDSQTNVPSWTDNVYQSFNASAPTTILHRYYRLRVTVGDGTLPYVTFDEILLYGPVTADVTLRTVTSTAATTPTHGSLFMVTKEVDSITPNTDVIGKIGKDGTTGMVTLTLSKIATIGVYAIYFGEADYTAGSGVTMQAEVTTANTKAWELYGLTHSWR